MFLQLLLVLWTFSWWECIVVRWVTMLAQEASSFWIRPTLKLYDCGLSAFHLKSKMDLCEPLFSSSSITEQMCRGSQMHQNLVRLMYYMLFCLRHFVFDLWWIISLSLSLPLSSVQEMQTVFLWSTLDELVDVWVISQDSVQCFVLLMFWLWNFVQPHQPSPVQQVKHS